MQKIGQHVRGDLPCCRGRAVVVHHLPMVLKGKTGGQGRTTGQSVSTDSLRGEHPSVSSSVMCILCRAVRYQQ